MRFNHVIILGGGFAGLLVTQLVSHYFVKVTLIERDELSLVHTQRKGIPQANHLHVLLQHGQRLIEHLMPGILIELRKLELQEIDWSQDVKWYGPFGSYPKYESNIKTFSFSRVWLNQLMYKRISNLNNLTIIKGSVLSLTKNNERIYAVRYSDSTNNEKNLSADLIIEARGRNSNAAQMLKQLGFDIHPPRIVNNELGYASRIYRSTHKNHHDFKQIYLQVRPGKTPRGVVISPIENKQMIVTAIGLGENKPQRDELQFQNFLTQLPVTELQTFLSTLQPVGNIHIYRNLKNRHHFYGKIKKWPAGFIIVGDAACVLNPVYGQGMTLAAKQIMVLKSILDGLQKGNMRKWEHYFQKKVDRLTLLPWLLATAEDQRGNPIAAIPFYLRCVHRYFDKILSLATRHHDIHLLFIEVMHMVKSPHQFFHPAVLAKVLFR